MSIENPVKTLLSGVSVVLNPELEIVIVLLGIDRD